MQDLWPVGLPIRITDQEPGDVSHLEAVVGDGPESLDLASSVGGISPFSCGVIDRSSSSSVACCAVAEAIDSAQQTARSARIQLTLSDAAAVDAPPTVAITQPTQGSTLRAGTRFSVRATASDDKSVREVNLVWQSPTGSQTFRLENLGAGTYGLDLSLSAQASAGARTLTVVAMDDAGQKTSSAKVTVQLVR